MNLKTVAAIVLSLASFLISQTTQPYLPTAYEAEQALQKAYDDAHAKMNQDKDYIAVKNKCDTAEKKLSDARKNSDMKLRLEASGDFSRAKKELSDFVANYESNDNGIITARFDLEKARERQAEETRYASETKKVAELRAEKTRREGIVRYYKADTYTVGMSLVQYSPENDLKVLGDKYCMIYLYIKNNSETKKIDFKRWSSDLNVKLSDDLGNSYKVVVNPNTRFLQSESIYPSKDAEDLLIFEKPIAAAKKMILKLPQSNLGMDGTPEVIFDLAQ